MGMGRGGSRGGGWGGGARPGRPWAQSPGGSADSDVGLGCVPLSASARDSDRGSVCDSDMRASACVPGPAGADEAEARGGVAASVRPLLRRVAAGRLVDHEETRTREAASLIRSTELKAVSPQAASWTSSASPPPRFGCFRIPHTRSRPRTHARLLPPTPRRCPGSARPRSRVSQPR